MPVGLGRHGRNERLGDLSQGAQEQIAIVARLGARQAGQAGTLYACDCTRRELRAAMEQALERR